MSHDSYVNDTDWTCGDPTLTPKFGSGFGEPVQRCGGIVQLGIRYSMFRPFRAFLASVLVLTACLVVPGAAVADVTTVSRDNLRTGWDSAEGGLTPAAVTSSDFGQQFATQLDGQIYAQPLVVGGTLIAATEHN